MARKKTRQTRRFGYAAPRAFKPVRVQTRIQTSIRPAVGFNKRACDDIKDNPCGTKLVFVGKADAKDIGIDPGPAVLVCDAAAKPGAIVSVRSAKEATAVGAEFCRCRAGTGGKAGTCLLKTTAGFKEKTFTKRKVIDPNATTQPKRSVKRRKD